MHRMLTALTFALAPLAANAEQIGTVTATVDGAEMTWYLAAENGESQSFAMKAGGIPAYNISVWANPEPDVLAALKGALVLDFIVPAAGGVAMAPGLQFFENGYSGFWVALDEGEISVALSGFEIAEDTISVSGQFEATAAFTDDSSTLETDPNRTKSFSGAFEATLPLR
ncbi:hypothetical protein [Sinisalibacter aestuarii]|uniref:MatB fimbrillin n=1 Tax=Sinisalibacter aestuarii TaxID=2949426 RepID=A0ABQ5LP65_9RHOB|nr:hypothetical protein [Sinisalibacter aestuarii]GKY86790.1 hypothetical protein STA1M1_06590 [Sinisalibacter aestuarii]